MKVNYSKVIGFQEALDLMKIDGCALPEDSYTTDVVDYITGNTAPFQFFLGEKDLEYITTDENILDYFLAHIHICHSLDTTKFEMEQLFSVENYLQLRYALSKLPRIQHQSLYKQWVDTLPYVKELGVAK